MKKIFLSIFIFIAINLHSQSNNARTIQLGLGIGLSSSTSSIATSVPDANGNLFSKKFDGKAFISNYSLKLQYGLSESFSFGPYIKKENFYSDNFGSDNFLVFDASTTGFGLEGKYYLINNIHFNLSVNPSIGFSRGKNQLFNPASINNSSSRRISGFSYGIGSGFNWYWRNTMGMYLNATYLLNNLSGSYNNLSNKDIDYKFKSSGVLIDFGLSFKFN